MSEMQTVHEGLGCRSICIIPARGGSKRLLNKNIVDINGSPLISYSIRAAIGSGVFDKVIVSTDSEKIKEVAEEEGAEVPFLRPEHLATDESLVEDTICHVLEYLENKNDKYDYVCLAQCSAPMVLPEDFKNVISIAREKEARIVVSVAETSYNINWVGKLREDMSMENFFGSCKTRCQDFEKTYILNGSIYFGEWDVFYNKENYYSKKTFAYVMPQERSYDIDTKDDLELVRYLMGNKNA